MVNIQESIDLKVEFTNEKNPLIFKNIKKNKINFLIASNGAGKSILCDLADKSHKDNLGTLSFKESCGDKWDVFGNDNFKVKKFRQEKRIQKQWIGKFTHSKIINKRVLLFKNTRSPKKENLFTSELTKSNLSKIQIKVENLDLWRNVLDLYKYIQQIKTTKWFGKLEKDRFKNIDEMEKRSKKQYKRFKSFTSEFPLTNNDLAFKIIRNIKIEKIKTRITNFSINDSIKNIEKEFVTTFPELKDKMEIKPDSTSKKSKSKVQHTYLKINDGLSKGQIDLIYMYFSLHVYFLTLKNKEASKTNKNVLVIIDEIFDFLDQSNIMFALDCLKEFIKKISPKQSNANKETKTKIYLCLTTHLDPSLFWGGLHDKLHNYCFAEDKAYFCMETNGKCRSFASVNKLKGEKACIHLEESGSVPKNMINLFEDGEKNYKSLQEDKDFCPISVAYYLRIIVENELYYNKEFGEEFKKNYLRKEGKNAKVFIDEKIKQEQELEYHFLYKFVSLTHYTDQMLHPENWNKLNKKTVKYIMYSFNSYVFKQYSKIVVDNCKNKVNY